MGEVIASGRTVAGSNWRLEGVGPWLDLLPQGNRVNARNHAVRWSLVEMGYAWAGHFLGRRFTNYVRRAPFFYKLSFTNTVRKFRRMGLLAPIIARELHGWDPWDSAAPPRILINEYRMNNPGVGGAFSRTGNFSTLAKTIRHQAKEIIRKYIHSIQYTKLRPLVESGTSESTAMRGHRVEATSTAKNSKAKVLIPFGGPRNPVVGAIVTKMPTSEILFCAQTLRAILARRLSKTGIPPPGPLPIERASIPAGQRGGVPS